MINSSPLKHFLEIPYERLEEMNLAAKKKLLLYVLPISKEDSTCLTTTKSFSWTLLRTLLLTAHLLGDLLCRKNPTLGFRLTGQALCGFHPMCSGLEK